MKKSIDITPIWSGGPFEFSGTDFYETPELGISGNQTWTIAAWIYQRGTQDEKDPGYEYYRPNPDYQSKAVWGWGTPGCKTGGFLYFNSVKMQLEYGFDDSYTNFGVTPAIYSHYTWYHVASTYDGHAQIIYINGEPVSRWEPAPLQLAAAKVLIGKDPFGQGRFFTGKMTEVKIFDRALADTEIADLMANPPPASEGYGVVTVSPVVPERDPYYKKYYKSPSGIPIYASRRVGDHTFILVSDILEEVLKKIKADWPGIFSALVLHPKFGVCIQSYMEQTTDIPEWSDLKDANFARGMGGDHDFPFSGCGEENVHHELFCHYRDEGILVHEFGHTLHGHGLYAGAREIYDKVTEAYEAARKQGKWENTYAGSNIYEYFATGVTSWYNVSQRSATGEPDGTRNHVDSRAKLKEYDYGLYTILESLFDASLLPEPWHMEKGETNVDSTAKTLNSRRHRG